ncbi:hypothetical protein [Chloroflexus sp.]|uniref:hypothetical protein n=1 Tax=Chloroflexus sp. TaxID=1904827 RepID=UPI002ACD4208|nr:hypothetical protein [Chloroflexus sp.]
MARPYLYEERRSDDSALSCLLKDTLMEQHIVMHVKAKGGLPLPGCLVAIMAAVFSMPLLVIPFTWQDAVREPYIILFWPLAFVPLGIVAGLYYLFQHFALTLYHDGRLVIAQPFKTVTLRPDQVGQVIIVRGQADVGDTTQRVSIPWLFFLSADRREVARVSIAPFNPQEIQQLLDMLRHRWSHARFALGEQ